MLPPKLDDLADAILENAESLRRRDVARPVAEPAVQRLRRATVSAARTSAWLSCRCELMVRSAGAGDAFCLGDQVSGIETKLRCELLGLVADVQVDAFAPTIVLRATTLEPPRGGLPRVNRGVGDNTSEAQLGIALGFF